MTAPAQVYVATCSCRRWHREGTADQLYPLVTAHDDSPWQKHRVSISPYGPVRDADFEAARQKILAAMRAEHPEWFEETG